MTPEQAVVIAALIGAVASIIVNLISASGQRKKRAAEEAVKAALLETRLVGIENKLDAHNGYGDKIGSIEKDIAVIRTKIEMLASKA